MGNDDGKMMMEFSVCDLVILLLLIPLVVYLVYMK
jgi:hypothetical protein